MLDYCLVAITEKTRHLVKCRIAKKHTKKSGKPRSSINALRNYLSINSAMYKYFMNGKPDISQLLIEYLDTSFSPLIKDPIFALARIYISISCLVITNTTISPVSLSFYCTPSLSPIVYLYCLMPLIFFNCSTLCGA